jgi:hypothetical protein
MLKFSVDSFAGEVSRVEGGESGWYGCPEGAEDVKVSFLPKDSHKTI